MSPRFGRRFLNSGCRLWQALSRERESSHTTNSNPTLCGASIKGGSRSSRFIARRLPNDLKAHNKERSSYVENRVPAGVSCGLPNSNRGTAAFPISMRNKHRSPGRREPFQRSFSVVLKYAMQFVNVVSYEAAVMLDGT